jgi:Ca2+-binding EF-hand superfamily protein
MSIKIIVGSVAGLGLLAGGAIIAARMGADKGVDNMPATLATAQDQTTPEVEELQIDQPTIILDERDVPEAETTAGGPGDRRGFQRDGGRFGSRESRMADMLERFDKDGDGELNDEERQAAREAFRAEREARRQAWLLEQYDKDGDGVLNEEEQAQLDADREAREAERAKREAENKQRALEAYDADGDGELSEAEKQEGRQARREYMMEQREAFTARFDTNGDGELTGDERLGIRETMGQVFGEMRFVRSFDANGDNLVTAADMPAYMDLFYSGSREADVNRDGVVDEADLADFQQRVLTPPSQDILDALAAFQNAPPSVDGDGGFRGRGGGGQRDGARTQGGTPQSGASTP